VIIGNNLLETSRVPFQAYLLTYERSSNFTLKLFLYILYLLKNIRCVIHYLRIICVLKYSCN
jgi:hypothetical protein